MLGEAAAPHGPRVVFYLAAAVSDFYLPWSHLVSEGPARGHHNVTPPLELKRRARVRLRLLLCVQAAH